MKSSYTALNIACGPSLRAERARWWVDSDGARSGPWTTDQVAVLWGDARIPDSATTEEITQEADPLSLTAGDVAMFSAARKLRKWMIALLCIGVTLAIWAAVAWTSKQEKEQAELSKALRDLDRIRMELAR